MSNQELIDRVIEEYAKLQRIMQAEDPRKEMEHQKRILEAKLQAFGIVTQDIQFD